MASRATMVHFDVKAGPNYFDPAFDYMERMVKDGRNRMYFSRLIEHLFYRQYRMTDVDSILFKPVYDRFGRFRDEKVLAAFELKFKSPRTVEGRELELNGGQFLRIRRVARMLRVPLYYFVSIGGEKFVMFNVLNVKPQFETRYEGKKRDYYAILDMDDLIVSNSLEDLRTDLKFLLERR
ncbi:hypothetical protein [Thermococcus sp.]|uniref:hypothetical protein n=1 Tax=Thermococcus sp. TaxID=35749 RepID=UPI0026227F10|nr:hypothetical protein [Thermococcus sp.]